MAGEEGPLAALNGSQPSVQEVTAVVACLQEMDDIEIEQLYDSRKAALIFERLESISLKPQKSASDKAVESQLLAAIKAMMGKAAGLERLCRTSELVARLSLSLDSDELVICTQVLELLAVLAVTSEAGYESVRGSMEYFRLVKKERVRFERLVAALASKKTAIEFQRDVMLFVNTLVNSAPDVELRVEVRGELCRAGMMEAVASLKERNLVELSSDHELSDEAYELEVQLQVFESVLENDHEQLLVSVDANTDDVVLGAAVALDDADALFEAVKQHAIEYDCFSNLLALLQYLVAVPSYDALGKQHWAALEIAAHKIVLGMEDDFALGFAELKQLLSWKRALESRSMALDDSNRELAVLKKRLADLESGEATFPTLEADPKYAGYFKMLLGTAHSREAVEAKMKAAGLDPLILDMDPKKSLAQHRQDLKNKPLPLEAKYAKYLMMLKMHLPRAAVELKMSADPLKPDIAVLDAWIAKNPQSLVSSSPSSSSGAATTAATTTTQKSGSSENGGAADAGPPLSEDPAYGKFFKMLRMNLPRVAVESKMRAEGLDPAILNRDPALPYATSVVSRRGSATGAPEEKKKPRRKAKAQPKPGVAMRSLFWSKIDDDDCDETVWKNLSDAQVRLDVSLLESGFAKSKLASNGGSKNDRSSQGASTTASGEQGKRLKELSLVDSKVSQNVGIALVKLKMSKCEIVEALISVDESKLDVQRTELLLKCAPSRDDATAVAEYVGEVSSLGRVEQFFREIARVPDYTDRLRCFLFKLRLEGTCEALDERLRLVASACEKVAQSERLARLLEVVLALGNYLNGGSTSRGGCYGFRLDALTKLGAVKSVDNKRSLLHYLADYCERSDPEILEILNNNELLDDLEPASRCSLQQWLADFGALNESMTLVTKHLESLRLKSPVNCRFVVVFEPFSKRAKERASDLERRFAATRARFENLVSSFGEDQTCTVDVFFKDLIGDFLRALAKAKLENDHKRQMDDKAAKKRAASDRKAALRGNHNNPTELVGETLNLLKSSDATDILAKLQGPRQRRHGHNQRSLTSQSNSPQASSASVKDSASYHMAKFISRTSGVKGAAKEKLDALRGASNGISPASSPKASSSDIDAPKRAHFAHRPAHTNSSNGDVPPPPPSHNRDVEPSPRRRASMHTQSELQKLASPQLPSKQLPSSRATTKAPPLPKADDSSIPSPPARQNSTKSSFSGGGELFAKLASKTIRKKKPPSLA